MGVNDVRGVRRQADVAVPVEWGTWGVDVLCIDPGEVTGVAAYKGRTDRSLSVCEIYYGHIEVFSDILKEVHIANQLVSLSRGMDVVVIEDFVLRLPAKSSDRAGISAARITAAYMATLPYVDGLVVKSQSAGQKDVINDTRLRALGLWVKGSDHIRDALRHMELFRRSSK